MRVYLDNAATTGLSDSMKAYLISVLNEWGNPSSLHSRGARPKQIISEARQSVAAFINADPEDIYFTSGGSASNTLAIKGYEQQNHCSILYSPIAHKSILKCAASCHDNIPLKVDNTGRIHIHDLETRLDACRRQPFVVIDYANSEIGTVQNIEEIIRLTHSHRGIVYLDCTGSIPTLPLDVKRLDADIVGFSAHKIGGLKGCGVLYKNKNMTLEPLIYGGQEEGLVGGTENVLGIASLGKAVQDYDYPSVSPANRDYVYDYIMRKIPDSYLIGASIESGNRLPHNLYMCFKGVEGESLVMLLDMMGIQASTGSACNSNSLTPSAALSAIGMDEQDIHSCIRMTFSGRETPEELNYVNDTLKKCVEDLREGFL